MQAAITTTLVAGLKPGKRPYQVHDTRLRGFFVRVQPSGRKAFYVTWGRGKRKSLGPIDTLAAERARTLAKEVLAQHYMGQDPREKDRAAKRAITFDKFITDRYAPVVEANTRTGKDTVRRLKQSFPDLLNKQISAITAWDIDKWRNQAVKRGLKPASINRNLAIIRSALNQAVEWGLIKSNPLDGIKMSKADTGARIVRFLSDDELQRLLLALNDREEELRVARDSANEWRSQRGYDLLPNLRKHAFADHLKPMVLLALHTGIRRGELFSLTWDSIDLKGAVLTVHGAYAKSGNTRHVPLNTIGVATLRAWRNQSGTSGLVFPSETGERFNNVRKCWDGVLKRARIKQFRWHDLRHHFASLLVQRGVDLVTVRELMGHSDFALTLRYAHTAPEHRVAAVARLVS